MIASIHHVSVSVGGLIFGLLLGAAVYLIGAWLATKTGEAIFQVLGAIIAIIIFIALGFDFY